MPRILGDCTTDYYGTVEDWYMNRLKMVSPTMDGNNTQLVEFDPTEELRKANIASSTSGAFNESYAWGVFINYSTQANQLGVLPKKPWAKQGYRAVSTGGVASDIGVAEGQALGTAVAPTYNEVAVTIKEIEAVFDLTQRMSSYNGMADVITLEDNRNVGSKAFYKSWDVDLLSVNTTITTANVETIDRIISSYAEWNGDSSMTTGDANPWDGGAGSRTGSAVWSDAYVSHNSGTDRTLTISLVDELRENVEPYWDRMDNKAFVTTYGTWKRWSALEESKHRLTNDRFSFTIGDGIKTSTGAEGGFKLASWDGIPIIRDANVVTDTIGRIYLEDLDNLFIAMARPPTYQEANPDTNDVFAAGHVHRGVHYGQCETYCTFFKTQAKLRDLK